jgi:hypothetical protein
MDYRIEMIKNRIVDLGFDCWILNENFVILNDGFVKEFPIKSQLDLVGSYVPNVDLVAKLCVDNHKTSKEIDDGKYDNFVGFKTKLMLKKIIEHGKKRL